MGISPEQLKRHRDGLAIDEALMAIDALWDLATSKGETQLLIAACTRVLICTHDLAKICQRNGLKLPHELRERVRKCRNGAGHLDDAGSDIDAARCRFMFFKGKGSPAHIGGAILESEYEDDLAIYFGTNRVYAYRDLQRIVDAARKLRPSLILQVGAQQS